MVDFSVNPIPLGCSGRHNGHGCTQCPKESHHHHDTKCLFTARHDALAEAAQNVITIGHRLGLTHLQERKLAEWLYQRAETEVANL